MKRIRCPVRWLTMSDWSTQASSQLSTRRLGPHQDRPSWGGRRRSPSSGAAGHLRLAEGLEILVRVAHLALQGPLHEELVGEVPDEAARKLVVHLEGAVRAGPGRLVADRVASSAAAGGRAGHLHEVERLNPDDFKPGFEVATGDLEDAGVARSGMVEPARDVLDLEHAFRPLGLATGVGADVPTDFERRVDMERVANVAHD